MPPSPKFRDPTGIIIGAVVGGIAVIGVSIGVAIVLRRKRSRWPNQRRGVQDPALGIDIESVAAAERAATYKAAAEKAVAEKNAAAEKAVVEKTAAAAEKKAAADKAADEKAAAEKKAAKKAAAEKKAAAAAEKAAAEKAVAEKKAAAEKVVAEEKAAAEKAAAEKSAAERAAEERLAVERAAAERAEDKLSHWRMELDKMANARAELCKGQERVRLLATVAANEDESLRDATKVRNEARVALVRVLEDALSAHEEQRRSLTAEAAALQQQQQQGECALTLAEQVWLIGPDGILWALIGSDWL